MTPDLYDGYEGYRSPTREQQREAVASWLVVLDTNVLLNLYSYQGAALDDFMRVFAALGDRLFVPHQVIDEFWRNRRTVLSQNKGRHREREVAEKAFDDVEDAVRGWHARVVDRGKAPSSEVMAALRSARTAVLDLMDRGNAAAKITLPDTPTHEDRVLAMLERLLTGKVGVAPAPDDQERLLAEGRRRIAARTPPGYLDADKTPERAAGDYFVWLQAMAASKRLNMPLLLITQDQKEDWWADRGTATMRARPELVQELLEVSGQPLIMMRAHDLLSLGDVLGVEVSQATVAEAEEVADDELEPETPVLTAGQALYKEFWSLFESPARERGWAARNAPPTVNWWSMSAGGGGNTYGVSYSTFGCRAELYFGHHDGEVNKHRFGVLLARAEEIQDAFGSDDTVVFDDIPGAQACRIELRNEDGRRIRDQSKWEDTIDWMIDRHVRLRRAIESVGGVPRSLPD